MRIGFDADQDCSRVAAAAVAKGATFVCRYLKNLSAAEVAALHAAGLAVVLIWETTAERAMAGAFGGLTDGARARSVAAAMGAPLDITIAATADFDVTPAQQAAVLAYFSGFKHPHAPLMVYSNGAVCQVALDAGIADFTWLAGGRMMRGTQAFLASGKATIVQDVGDKRGLNLGIDIDSDTAIDGDIGAWMPPPVFHPARIAMK